MSPSAEAVGTSLLLPLQLEPALEHCKTIFHFDLPLWILFLKLINVQVPAIH